MAKGGEMSLFNNNDDSLSLALREHVQLMRIIGEKDAEIAQLRAESGVAREAVDRFCAPSLRPGAIKWLEGKGLA